MLVKRVLCSRIWSHYLLLLIHVRRSPLRYAFRLMTAVGLPQLHSFDPSVHRDVNISKPQILLLKC